MSHATPEELAKKIAAEANTCCYRSDGYEEHIMALALSAINEAVAAERERCARLCEEQAESLCVDEQSARVWLLAADFVRAASTQHLDTARAICDNPRT